MSFARSIAHGLLAPFIVMLAASPQASAQQQRPNIVAIMGDDIGWFNIGAYHETHPI